MSHTPGRPGSVTLNDVAREAEVAVSTVSRALTNPDRVSRATREHVVAIARQLGYRASRAAGRHPMLAMLVAGYMAKQGRASAPQPQMGGGLGDVLAGLVGGGQGGGAGLASMLDLDGDGNPLDDILGMAGKLTRG